MVEKTEDNTTFIINSTSKPNSFEFGKANNRMKIYFADIEELMEIIKKLKEQGFTFEELDIKSK